VNNIIREDINRILEERIPFDKFYNKTILISGANGYVPSYFVYLFMAMNNVLGANIHVIVLCRNEERAKERFCDYWERDDFEVLIQDVCDSININKSIQVFIHAASPAGIRKRHEDPVNTFLANVKGAENMLNLAINNECEAFLLLSSVDVYGKMSGTDRLTEDMSGYLDTLNVRNAYSNGKRAAESLCTAYAMKHQLPVYVVRPFQIIGPGLELNDGRLHIDFISQILDKKQIALKSDGTAVRSFMYITDAIIAMLYVLVYGKSGEAYNIVDENGEASVKELADIMAANVEVDGNMNIPVIFDYEHRNTIEVTGALSVVTGDSLKVRNLGWKPYYSLKEAAKRMMMYYGL